MYSCTHWGYWVSLSPLFACYSISSSGKESVSHTHGISNTVFLIFLSLSYNVQCCRVFHLTSPNMNYFILFGSYLIFVAPFLEIPFYSNDLQVWTVNCIVSCHVTSSCSIWCSFNYECIHTTQVAQFTNHIGYSLIIGTILAKLCHTYYTYHDPEKTNKPVR